MKKVQKKNYKKRR